MKNTVYSVVKRIFDITAALLAITVFIIPWIIIGIIIKIQSPGPILYKAERIGKNGKTFVLYKFRSMCADSEKIHVTTLRNDSRIYPFGEFLRKTKLDETPQLLNIILNDMSVIGPRPEDKVNFEKLYIGKYKNIVSVKPGLSSPASLFDYTVGEKFENEEDYVNIFVPKKLEMELYYVKKCSFLYDMEIVMRTILTIFFVLIGYENFKEPKEMAAIREENGDVRQETESYSIHAGR